MALDIKLNLKLAQSLIITPQLQQAIKLLQLSQMELAEHIEKEMLENPLLEDTQESDALDAQEIDKKSGEQSSADAIPTVAIENEEIGGKEGEFKNTPEDFDWDNYVNTYNAPEITPIQNNDDLPSYENILTSKTSLSEHLTWQLHLSNLSPTEIEIGELIIGSLNDDGYLKESIEELANKSKEEIETVEKVLGIVQAFDPPGVAARDLKECLLLQIKNLGPDEDILRTLITDHLPSLEKKDYHHIVKKLRIPITRVLALIKLIHNLEPKPGREFNTSSPQYIAPDVFARKIGNEWIITLNEDGLPKLRISALYRSMLNKEKGKTREYVQDKLRSAIWLIRSIHQRQRTLYRVSKTILKFQKDFFERGVNALRPMILKDVANEIEMHESTVSRVTTNKYIHTPHGLFELKFFFSSSVASLKGESVASESVKNKIQILIAQENPKKPLSDQTIAKHLQLGNIDIARRTVAKYREILGILPSSKRRQFY